MIPLHELQKLYRPSHSRFQMDQYITLKTGMTPYGMMRQALRELFTRWEGATSLQVEINRTEIEFEKSFKTSKHAPDPIEGRLIAQSMVEQTAKLIHLRKALDETLREASVFNHQAQYLRSLLPKQLDDETIEKLEVEMWACKIKMQAALEMLSGHNPSVTTLEAIVFLPPEVRDPLWQELDGDLEALTRWAKMYQPKGVDMARLNAVPGKLLTLKDLDDSDNRQLGS